MATFQEEYLKLLIFQYQDKEKAVAEINLKSSIYEKIYELHNSFETAFDLDLAEGVQLDILGRIIGVSRTTPSIFPKEFFGFNNKNENALGFSQAPFYNQFDKDTTDLQMTDTQYRHILRAKAVLNNTSTDIAGINEDINFVFRDKTYIVDNYDMTIDLYLDQTFDSKTFEIIKLLNLLPKPSGVGYNNIILI